MKPVKVIKVVKMKTAIIIMMLMATSAFAQWPARNASKHVTMPNIGNSSKPALLTPTFPGTTVPDYSRSNYKISKDRSGVIMIDSCIPGTDANDFHNPSYRISRDRYGNAVIDSCIPGTTIPNFKEPSYVIEVGE